MSDNKDEMFFQRELKLKLQNKIEELDESDYVEALQAMDSLIKERNRYNKLIKKLPQIITTLPFMKVLSISDKIKCCKILSDENTCKFEKIDENNNLFEPGEEFSKVFFITKGLIKLSSKSIQNEKKNEKKDEEPFSLLSIGDVIGELESLNGDSNKTVCTAKAVLEDVEGISISKDAFKILLKNIPSIYKWLHLYLSTKIVRQGIEWNSQDKYVKVLFTLAIACGNPAFKKSDNDIAIRASGDEFGDIIGTYRQDVKNILHQIEGELNKIKKNTIIIEGPNITIKYPDILKNKCKELDSEQRFTRLYSYR